MPESQGTRHPAGERLDARLLRRDPQRRPEPRPPVRLPGEGGLWDTTIIQFTSDHGYNIGHHGIHAKGNGLWVAGGVQRPEAPEHVGHFAAHPAAVRWPGVVQGGTVIEQPVLNLDTFPSVLGMLNVDAARGLESRQARNFAPLLRGEEVTGAGNGFGQYDLHNGGLAYMRMIRTDEWKYVRHFHENLMDELYDLEKDPGETNNLIAKKRAGKEGAAVREVLKELHEKLVAWQKSIDDPVLSEPRLMHYEVIDDKD